MNGQLVVGIDSSTSATKAIAWDAEGNRVAEGRKAISLSNPRPGEFEQAPADWWSSTVAALRELTSKIDPQRLAGLAISNQRETFGAFAENGGALRPGMVWLDDRARPQTKRFGESFGAERVHEISGKPLDVIPCLYRLIWMREHEPDIFERAAFFAEVHGYLCFRLTGRKVTSTASADPMGLLDMRSFTWSRDIFEAAGIPLSKMPALVRPGEFVGRISDAVAAETGLPQGLRVFAGGGDGQCAGTGVAVLQPGRAYVNLGTAAVAGIYGETYAYNRHFRTETAIAEEGYIYETCVRSGTFLVDWLAGEVFGVESTKRREALAELEAQASTLPIGAEGLVLAPYWQGCMTPHWDSNARGLIAGLTGSTRRANIFRAILEGVALEIAQSMEAASSASGVAIDHYVAIGGGASSDLWTSILADASARPVRRSPATEASSLGAAMAAAKGAGWYPTLKQASLAMAATPTLAFEPDPRRVELYREFRGIHADLWPIVRSWNDRLTAFAEKSQTPT
jgi:sugar (pentulose or hexulose) kinase